MKKTEPALWGADRKVCDDAAHPSDFPAVGDFVRAGGTGKATQAVIYQVLPRKSVFMRKAAGSDRKEQLVVTNIDIVFLCMALNQDFNVRRLERYLSIAWDSGAKPVVVLTKPDICEDIEEKLPYLSAGTTAAFLGSSGVGKSTLVNRLLREERFATGGIRNDDKGRHTTTHRELLFLPDGGMVIDTPGMREVGMWDAKSGIDSTFSDIEELALQCRFRDCTHTVEQGCAVQKALKNGTLSKERMQSYQKLKTENDYMEHAKSYLEVAVKNMKQRNGCQRSWVQIPSN